MGGKGLNIYQPFPEPCESAPARSKARSVVRVSKQSRRSRSVPELEAAGPNGIEVSPDGAWLYINLWPARKMMRLSRGQTPVKKDVVDVPFHPDNMRWQSNGTLLSAGHDAPTMARATECLRVTCNDAAARVARWDPKTLKVQEAVRYPSDDVFFGATAALQVGKEIWIGSVRGDRIARYPAR